MTGDRRGFRFALQPVRSLTEWKLNDMAREFAALEAACVRQQQEVAQLIAALAAVRCDIVGQRTARAVIDIDRQRRSHAYLAQVQHRLELEQAQWRLMQEERDGAATRLTEVRKFADSLERSEQSAAALHDKAVRRSGYLNADDNWLQRLHWRKSL